MQSHAAAAQEPTAMTTQDLTTFTESGANAPLFTVLSGSVSVDANSVLDAKLWKDFGAGHFFNFVHDDIDLNVTAVGAASAFIVWVVSNVPGNWLELVAADGACWLEVSPLGAGYQLRLFESVTTQHIAASMELDFGTDYTIAVTRSGTLILAVISTISDGPVDLMVLAINGSFTFRYLTAAATRGAGLGSVTTLTIGAMDINEAEALPRSRNRFRNRGRGIR